MTIGARLREERDRLGLNQTDFGAIGGVSKMSQINYEKNEHSPSAAYLGALAKQGVDVLYVITGVHADSAQASQAGLSQVHRELIDCFDRADDDGKRALRTISRALAKQ